MIIITIIILIIIIVRNIYNTKLVSDNKTLLGLDPVLGHVDAQPVHHCLCFFLSLDRVPCLGGGEREVVDCLDNVLHELLALLVVVVGAAGGLINNNSYHNNQYHSKYN